MDRQRNKTKTLDHESNATTPSKLSRWFTENDAAEIFTREIFFKLQEEILSSCLEMQIKKMSEDENGVTNLEIRDVKVKDKILKVRSLQTIRIYFMLIVVDKVSCLLFEM